MSTNVGEAARSGEVENAAEEDEDEEEEACCLRLGPVADALALRNVVG